MKTSLLRAAMMVSLCAVVPVLGPVQRAAADQASPMGIGTSLPVPGFDGQTLQQANAAYADDLVKMDQAGKLNAKAQAELNDQQYAQAEADAREALALQPHSGLGQEFLAAALFLQGKDQEALQIYQTMAQQGNDAPRNLLPYALLLLKAGDWTDALAAYQKALPLVSEQNSPVFPHLDQTFIFSPDDPQQAQLAAAIHIAMGLTLDGGDFHGSYQARIEQAQGHFQQAVELAPDSDLANYYYGYGLQRLGRTAQAQAAFNKTLKLAHGSVKIAARKALAKLKTPA